jgi:hypothetical protein
MRILSNSGTCGWSHFIPGDSRLLLVPHIGHRHTAVQIPPEATQEVFVGREMLFKARQGTHIVEVVLPAGEEQKRLIRIGRRRRPSVPPAWTHHISRPPVSPNRRGAARRPNAASHRTIRLGEPRVCGANFCRRCSIAPRMRSHNLPGGRRNEERDHVRSIPAVQQRSRFWTGG